MKPLLISSGEPAGVGPDLCLALAASEIPLVILGDKLVLEKRAEELQQTINLIDYQPNKQVTAVPGQLPILSIPCQAPVRSGQLDVANAFYVRNMLELAVDKCLQGEFAALVTAPVHKGIINQAGIDFTGHTEFLEEHCKSKRVVMMLACETMKVALITTHLPLKKVADKISISLITELIEVLDQSLKYEFGISDPQIYVTGLNPHAGEGGYLGREEIEIIEPALKSLKNRMINVHGPFPADSLFTPYYLKKADVFVAMYHDQGLPVLKYAGFGSAVNITLGLPIIRTSVDHGTALELAGSGKANPSSLIAAVKMAHSMAKQRKLNGHY